MTIPQITQALAGAGAVRAMELDANDIYPNFSVFTPAMGAPASVLNGTEVVPGFSGPERYFTASWNRDFFAAFARRPAPAHSTSNSAADWRRYPYTVPRPPRRPRATRSRLSRPAA